MYINIALFPPFLHTIPLVLMVHVFPQYRQYELTSCREPKIPVEHRNVEAGYAIKTISPRNPTTTCG